MKNPNYLSCNIMLPNMLFFSSDGELIGITLEGIDNIQSLDYIY